MYSDQREPMQFNKYVLSTSSGKSTVQTGLEKTGKHYHKAHISRKYTLNSFKREPPEECK